jgi:lipopolysaccharide transport system permease protein
MGKSLSPPPKVIRSPRPSIRWALELLWTFAIQRVNLRYKESFFGFGWIFLQPVALTIIFTYIFQRYAPIPMDVPYPVFSATGLVAWTLTALVVSQSAISISSQSFLLKRIWFPKVLLPASVILSSMADLGVMILLLIALFALYPISFSWTVVWVPLLFAFHLLLLVGLSCIVSATSVFFRDVGHAIPSLLQLWFFASPVFYPASMVPQEFRAIAQWNPMTGLIEGYRATLLLGQDPPMDLFGPATLSIGAIFAFGLIYFCRLEGTLTDIL